MTGDSFAERYRQAWNAMAGSDRDRAEEAMRWFAANYPDPPELIAKRRAELNAEAVRLRAPGRRTPRRRRPAA